MNIVDHIFTLFERRGHAAYFGEAVSQLEHALPTAHQAEQKGAPDYLIIAALLHDFGHLLHGMPEDMAAFGVDGQHQDIGAAWLSRHFGTAVTEPIKLHVAAKRYLCAVEEPYQHQLPPASVQSLALQGGSMDAAEVQHFRRREWWSEAVWLRRLDDAAKIPGWRVPGLEHYRTLLQALSRQGRRV
jgi:[1-hydroxy-2-(trimethylamino)ethyl]phosphonate dioxygenase